MQTKDTANRSDLERFAALVRSAKHAQTRGKLRRLLRTGLDDGTARFFRLIHTRVRYGVTSKDALKRKRLVCARLSRMPVRTLMELLWAFSALEWDRDRKAREWAAFVMRSPSTMRPALNGILDKSLRNVFPVDVVNEALEAAEQPLIE